MPEFGKTRLRILQVYGSKGLPSCGMTDAGLIGQGEEETIYIGGSKDDIPPGTNIWEMPFSTQYQFMPNKLSKTPRNMEPVIARRATKKCGI